MTASGLLNVRPIIQAPMAGGASSPDLVAAVHGAGATGSLAAGYLSTDALAAQIAAVREQGVDTFVVNLFVPSDLEGDPDRLHEYRQELAEEAERHGATIGEAVHDDDGWGAKLDLLTQDPVPIVSFTFGCPSADVLARLREAGSATVVTVTTVEEARLAAAQGADALCVQGVEAGGHRATFDPVHGHDRPLLDVLPDVIEAVDIPVIGSGGVMTGRDVAAVLDTGAVAAQLGTAFLRCPESGAQPDHKLALSDPTFIETALTWAFTGRPARGLVNRFIDEHLGAPFAYPEIHHMTKPLRAAAAKAGDTGGMALWAGRGWRKSRDLPAAELVEKLRAEASEAGVQV
ncbi:nitronate monooxygenase [Nocardiopsis salina]|uniref:nitronate monooxygenase n=1 Tax=Nocardiopsis salina TaxID=245836 RepID=UPI00034BF348|nr:nitronate monooxygenase [Nocardiopsis salina]